MKTDIVLEENSFLYFYGLHKLVWCGTKKVLNGCGITKAVTKSGTGNFRTDVMYGLFTDGEGNMQTIIEDIVCQNEVVLIYASGIAVLCED